jgi:hypothetical protein
MNADETRSLFSEAYDGELDEETLRKFDAALISDPALGEEYESFCNILSQTALLGSDEIQLPEIDLLPAVQRKISERTRGRYFRGTRHSNSSLQPSWILMMLLVVLCLAAAIWMSMTIFDNPAGEGEVSPQGWQEPAPSLEPSLLRSEESIPSVSQAGNDITLLVEMGVDRGGVDGDIR